MAIFDLPDHRSSNYFAQLLAFGRFLETGTRSGCPHDLKRWPNLPWQTIEAKMLAGWQSFVAAKVGEKQLLMLQWYNSGVFLKTADKIMAFDILPVPRYYGWPEPEGLTARIAAAVDALFITHDHQDHFDVALVKACQAADKPVYMHPDAAPDFDGLQRMQSGAAAKLDNIMIKAVHCCHVWRKDPSEVPLTSFEISCGDYYRFLFCGDADYTRGFSGVEPQIDAVFITWRNPGPVFEDGHPLQTATTIDAVRMVIDELKPAQLVLEHYGELDHIYKGFSASYEMAIDLITRLPVPASLLFWGDEKLLANVNI